MQHKDEGIKENSQTDPMAPLLVHTFVWQGKNTHFRQLAKRMAELIIEQAIMQMPLGIFWLLGDHDVCKHAMST